MHAHKPTIKEQEVKKKHIFRWHKKLICHVVDLFFISSKYYPITRFKLQPKNLN